MDVLNLFDAHDHKLPVGNDCTLTDNCVINTDVSGENRGLTRDLNPHEPLRLQGLMRVYVLQMGGIFHAPVVMG